MLHYQSGSRQMWNSHSRRQKWQSINAKPFINCNTSSKEESLIALKLYSTAVIAATGDCRPSPTRNKYRHCGKDALVMRQMPGQGCRVAPLHKERSLWSYVLLGSLQAGCYIPGCQLGRIHLVTHIHIQLNSKHPSS